MASNQELFNLRTDSGLLNRITPLIVKKCKTILGDGAATAPAKEWAKTGYSNPESLKDSVIWPVLNNQSFQTVAFLEALDGNDLEFAVNLAIDDLIINL